MLILKSKIKNNKSLITKICLKSDDYFSSNCIKQKIMTDISDPFIICSSLLIIGINKNTNHKTSLFPNSQKNWWSILTIINLTCQLLAVNWQLMTTNKLTFQLVVNWQLLDLIPELIALSWYGPSLNTYINKIQIYYYR